MTLDLTHPHHDGSATYVSQAPRGLGASVALRVFVPDLSDGRPGAEHVVLRAVRDGEPHLTPATCARQVAGGAWWHVNLVLHNQVNSYRFFIGGPGYRWLNAAGIHERDTSDQQDFRINALEAPPDWVLDQVAYQVFPDRFAASRTDREAPEWAQPAQWGDAVIHQGPAVPYQWYGGDLDGVREHLDHLTELGATLLYLTPVFPARSNHRYDASSFDEVDEVLGGDEALERLIVAAHERGLKVLGDLTTNHTGRGHEWFTRAQADADSLEATFYRFDEHPDSYEAWLGIKSLPKLDHSSAELARRLYDGPDSITARWLRAGLDGWRVDVANMTGRMGEHDLAGYVARTMRATMHDVAHQPWLLAEHGHDASGDLLGDGWDGTMDYQGFTRPLWAWLNGAGQSGEIEPLEHGLQFLGLPAPIPVLDGTNIATTMREVHASMPWASWAASTMHLDSHDTPRFRTVTGGGRSGWVDSEGHGRARHLLGLAAQMTMPGIPSVFAGDEIGLTGVDGEHARTPYPWDRGVWDTETWDAYRTWVALRRDHVALRRGGLRWVDAGADSLTFLREHSGEVLLVHLARADHEPVRVPQRLLGDGQGDLTVLMGTQHSVEGTDVVLPSTAGVHVWAVTATDWEWV